ncbi:sialate O-acetylesterase [Seonamhaeicola aphaedonensis]|uniref:Sialate O-acetylesterase n=1 Tax=Seonamhaeicola aphaedonensis TaxID=1461338 RepID=A0A3D9HL67_9FLAO|nr:sialate O-acetylesterase [Seonamhaeicola aphaedonensis]RED50230.1 sialate O-acetylesterase [Seonamhaeicola aphaedonensis]
MKAKKLHLLAILFFSLMVQLVRAEVKLPAIVSSNMVLQRDTTVELWGWADANEKFSIKSSWLTEELKIKADDYGNWRISVNTNDSKAPQTIEIKTQTSTIILDNILFGEVWLCSGQSNMFQPLRGYNGQPTFGGNKAIMLSKNANLRLFTANKKTSETPLQDLRDFNSWTHASPETVSEFSAVAYFFGKQLQEILDVPVGLIHSSWGGSKIEAWMSAEVLENLQEEGVSMAPASKSPQRSPTILFNAMINPLIPYKIKGVLWYQGEANRQDPNSYKILFPAMVKDWRERWGGEEFPIYYAQIAPYIYSGDEEYKKKTDNTAYIREAQLECLNLIPNSGIAITLDIGEEKFIHPPKKKEVADRLLFNALNQTYGYTAIDYASPTYKSYMVKNGTIILEFNNVNGGLYNKKGLSDFEIAGDDKVFYPAEAQIIEGNKVLVHNNKVTEPKAVRYAWKNWVRGTLFDTSLLPVSSFRTDNW